MKILQLAQSDIHGGAARASWRLHRALVDAGVESRLLVRDKKSDDPRVEGPSRVGKFLWPLRYQAGRWLMARQKSGNPNYHSLDALPSRWSDHVNQGPEDLVHLHFVAGETLSLGDLGRIRKPVVWTFHDMWPFCGAEHYGSDAADARWRSGYRRGNRPEGHHGWDADRWVWKRKLRGFQSDWTLTAPSRWLAQCATESALFRGRPVRVIPNLLDTTTFRPLNQRFCREALGLPLDRPIVLFGALGGTEDKRKGWSLLAEGLRHFALTPEGKEALGVIFGGSAPSEGLPVPVQSVGHLADDLSLVLLYNAADVMVVPSRQEAFGQTASEAQACGTPVVAFGATGLLDLVDHQVSGYLARPFEAEDLAAGLSWVLSDASRRQKLAESARARALRLWAPEVVVPQFFDLYKEAR